jgi:hypothetical protein
MQMAPMLELVPTKSVSDKIARNIRSFLREFIMQHCRDRSKPSGIDYERVRRALNLSQGYVSDIYHGKKKANLTVIIGLRDATGASFEEITGHKPPLEPHYPMSLLPSDRSSVEDAVEEGIEHERPSSSGPAAPRVKRSRR